LVEMYNPSIYSRGKRRFLSAKGKTILCKSFFFVHFVQSSSLNFLAFLSFIACKAYARAAHRDDSRYAAPPVVPTDTVISWARAET
jgi:hypothetical protein